MSIEIIGWNEYQEHSKRFSDKLNTRYFFHPTFIAEVLNEDSRIEVFTLDAFCDFPECQGIYFCTRDFREVWYVGKSSNFNRRWKSHSKFEALRTIGNVDVYFLPLEAYSKEEISQVERVYINMLAPVFNNTSKPEKHLRLVS